MKIDKKKTELDRHHKRLQSLQTVRPLTPAHTRVHPLAPPTPPYYGSTMALLRLYTLLCYTLLYPTMALLTMQVRPAFMDEYERLEADLNVQYARYLQSWRNMSYLEAELDGINAREQEKIVENDRQLQLMQRR